MSLIQRCSSLFRRLSVQSTTRATGTTTATPLAAAAFTLAGIISPRDGRYFSSSATNTASNDSMTFTGSNNNNLNDFSSLSNEELADTSTIPGWNLIHTPPRKYPRGALVGTVVSDKMDRTVNVAVERHKVVPKYRKRLKYTRKFMAHDQGELANVGDLVMIVPCHKISKHKHFMLREIIRPKGQL